MQKNIEFYTADEAAKALRLHSYTVRRLCREKKESQHLNFGGQWRFRKDEIDDWSRNESALSG